MISETEEAQKRFLAIRLLEKDEKMDDLMKNPPDVSGLSEQLERELSQSCLLYVLLDGRSCLVSIGKEAPSLVET